MNISNMKQYPIDLQKQVINEVKNHNRLLSEIAKQYDVSAKTVYKWVRHKEVNQIETKSAILSVIEDLQQQITQLSQRLSTMAS